MSRYLLKSDNYETPSWAVEELMENLKLKPGCKIWCPFHGERGQMVKILRELGYEVVNDTQLDFFDYEPKEWDVLIDNPPFSQMQRIVKKALTFNHKPIILIMPLINLRTKWVKEVTHAHAEHFTCAIPHKRIQYDLEGKPTFWATFETCWMCWNTKDLWDGKEGIIYL